MHPLHECLLDLKSDLIGSLQGDALDLFSGASDLEIYASTKLNNVFCIIPNENDLKSIRERAPSRPAMHIFAFSLKTHRGLAWIRVLLTSRTVTSIWIYMNRFHFDLKWFEQLMITMYPLLRDDACVFLLCVDEGLARQFANSRLLYIDKDDNILMHSERQPLKNILSIRQIVNCCERNGYVHESSMQGDEMLQRMKKNALPYDLWSSQIFFLLQFRLRPHFVHLL